MKTKYVLIWMFLLVVRWGAHAQTSSDVYDRESPTTWLGIDFSMVKLSGDAEKFSQANNQKNLLAQWNDLVLREYKKFNLGEAINKRNVNNDFSYVNRHNEGIDFKSLIVEKPGPELERSVIRGIVASYDFGNLTGVGVMLIAESFDKTSNNAAFWITFVNLANRQVIFAERKTSHPGGKGIRNYWANSVYELFQTMGKREVEKWKRKYPGNYTEPPYDGAEVAYIQPPRPASKPLPNNTNTRVASPVQAKQELDKTIKPGGKYYALLIGVSQYADSRLNLDQPVADAKKIKEVLTQGYQFNSINTIVLENPTRGEIFSALYKLRDVVTPSDNLLIFYAGHGFWDEKIKQGYWWPRDATSSDPSNWLSNSDLREQLRGITSAHTLLISDACFSGGIFKTRDVSGIKSASMDYQMLYKMPSRRAITSGTLTAVPDRSVFVEYLLKRLNQNKEKFLPSQSLFSSIRLAIINNSAAVPQEGVIADTGDEGGDFIFEKK